LLPELKENSPDGVYVPLAPNFPAIDLVWKHGHIVVGVHVHVREHHDVKSTFIGLCDEAHWLTNFDKVYLLYLSPENEVTALVHTLVNPPRFEARVLRSYHDDTEGRFILLQAMSRDKVSCLIDLQWPDGCTL
jgi:hypothetical protein